MNTYTNLADSVHFNRTAAYVPTDCKEKSAEHFLEYANLLKKELCRILSSEDDQIAFTLNHISDNPVFFQMRKNNQESSRLINKISEELFDLLIQLLQRRRAFISTYKEHTVKSYAEQAMISSWKRICDDQTDDLRFVSSLVEELAEIKGTDDREREEYVHYSDRKKREAHDAVFGWERLVTIKDGNVLFGKPHCGAEAKYTIPIKQYLEQIKEESVADSKFGFYTGLVFEKDKIGRQTTDVFLERIKLLGKQAGTRYVSNDPFVNENDITLGTIMERIVRSNLFERLYEETVDSALEKRIRQERNKFLDISRKQFERLYTINKPTRSKIYEFVYPVMESVFKEMKLYSQTNYEKNSLRKYGKSFFFQVIDFCYNYYNYLLSYGLQENTSFSFYPYYTKKGAGSRSGRNIELGSSFNNQRQGTITLGNDLLREQIQYHLLDSDHKTVGAYLSFSSAKNAREERQKQGKKLFIADLSGDILPL